VAEQFASGRKAWGLCDRCSQRFRLRKLQSETKAGVEVNNLVCPSCFDVDHPQLMQGRRPVNDPQALRDSRPDTSYASSGPLADGTPGVGSR
jgi:hypothetical protein